MMSVINETTRIFILVDKLELIETSQSFTGQLRLAKRVAKKEYDLSFLSLIWKT
jgi:hypothetical protein